MIKQVTFNDYDNIVGIASDQFNFNNNTYSINASILGDYPDDNFILERTLFRNKHTLYESRKNFYYGTFILLHNNERLFFTFDTETNSYPKKLIWKYIGSKNDPHGTATPYKSQKIIVIND